MNRDFTVKIWGARGSYPTPGANTVKYGGNTSCAQINAGGRTIILDAGTGIIPLGRELVKKQNFTIRTRIPAACITIALNIKASPLCTPPTPRAMRAWIAG